MRTIQLRFRASRFVFCAALLGAAVAFSPARAQMKPMNAPPNLTPREIEMGKKSVEQLEKDPRVKLLDGSKDAKAKALLDKLNEMARVLGKASSRPLIPYSVKVLEDADVNAFTLPGGHIYMSRGLLDLASSDDEIAAVISHEIGHNARMHVLREQAKEKPLQWLQLAAMLAMLKGGQTGANIAQMTPYLLTGVVNKYSIEYEEEADTCAIEQMKQTIYNPSAMVTFMQKLSDEEKRHPEVQLGIYQDHPVSAARVQSSLDLLKQLGLPFTPRAVSGANEALVVTKEDRINVVWDAASLFEFAIPNVSKTPTVATPTSNPEKSATTPVVAVSPIQKRAQTAATCLNGLMRDNLRIHEISVNVDGAEATLSARGQEIARATTADAKLAKVSPLLLAQLWKSNLQRLFWKESLHGAM